MIKNSSSRHERRSQSTEKKIIQTTVALILEKGFDTVSIQDITDKADIGRGTFYIHFKSKEGVVWIAIKDVLHDLIQDIHKNYDRRVPKEKYSALCCVYKYAKDNRDLWLAVLGERGSMKLAGHVQDFLAEALLYDIKNTSSLRLREPNVPQDVLAQMLAGSLVRIILWWLETPSAYSIEQMSEYTYKLFYRRNPPININSPVQ
jgi:AcrR family transcriptional regulator